VERPSARDTAFRGPGELRSATPDQVIRAAAAILTISELAYLFVGPQEAAPPLRSEVVAIQALTAIVGAAMFCFTFTRLFKDWWRVSTLLACIAIIANTLLATLFTSDREWLVLTVFTLLVGASALAPWTTAWQSALSGAALAALAVFSWRIEFAPIQWLELAVAVGLGEITTRFGMRYRRELEARVDALKAAGSRVLAEADERAEAQRRAQAIERTMQKIFQAIPDAVAVTRLSDGAYVEVNRALLEASGLRREEVIGRTDAELDFWSSKPDRTEIARRLKRDGTVRDLELEFRVRDGKTVYALVNAAPMKIGGEPCMAFFGHDITASKNIERELRAAREELSRQVEALQASRRQLAASEATLRKIFDANLDPITINDMETGMYVDVNEEFLRRTGFKREEVIGNSYNRMHPWSVPGQRSRFMSELEAKGSVRNMEAEFNLKGGERIHCLVSAIVLELGGKRCCMSLARDVTELKETERQLVAAREAALAASRAKTEFLSSMSHEIRTPMNSILGMADLLAESAMSAEQRHYVESIVTNGNALLELINSVLDLARVESGRLTLETGTFDLREVMETAAATLAIAAHSKNLELTVRIAPGTPTALVGDAMRLRQVLINLVGNAIKFTDSGEISIEAQPAGDEPGAVSFSVRDTGIGISADQLARVFEAFTQADSSTTRKYGGSGLGLTIVRHLVQLMGGKVEVRSVPGQGSTFSFAARFGLQPAGAAAEEHRPDLAAMPVLLVDDVATARAAVAELLAECGARITEADSGERAIRLAQEALRADAPFQLAIIDSEMPGIGGYQAAKNLVQMGLAARTIVLMLCTNDLRNKVVRLRDLGLHLWVAKPVRRADLFDALSRALEIESRAAAVPTAAETPAAARSDRSAANGAANHVRPLQIMIADDSTDNRMLIRAYLRKTPWHLDEAENGREAIEMFKREHYDLVLMDVQMPEVDGYEATRAIRQWERDHGLPHTPILALTASALGDAARHSLAAGCDAHVTKPVKKDTLLALIRNAAQAHQGLAAQPESFSAEE
jgi:PAS domain S-box-containing protein